MFKTSNCGRPTMMLIRRHWWWWWWERCWDANVWNPPLQLFYNLLIWSWWGWMQWSPWSSISFLWRHGGGDIVCSTHRTPPDQKHAIKTGFGQNDAQWVDLGLHPLLALSEFTLYHWIRPHSNIQKSCNFHDLSNGCHLNYPRLRRVSFQKFKLKKKHFCIIMQHFCDNSSTQ